MLWFAGFASLGSSMAVADVCERSFGKSDRSITGRIEKSKTCELSWAENGKTEKLQVIVMQNACARFEGWPVGNCAWVRRCSDDPGKRDDGVPVHLDAETDQQFCRGQKVQLIGKPGNVAEPSAQVICDEKTLSVRLSRGEKEQSCILLKR